jgi:hypothetical protein
VSVESGCGCTIASVTPTTVQPGDAAVVTAIGTPLSSGERAVALTIHTDSVLSPEIVLHFEMITDRTPPFITEIAGDFAYPDTGFANESRDVLVRSVEGGQPWLTPIVQTDLPFLGIAKPTIREAPYDESSLKTISYTYRVTFTAKAPDGSFTGRIWAIDPKTGEKTGDLLVIHRSKRNIIAVPSAMTLAPGPDRTRAEAQLTLLLKQEMPQLVVETATQEGRPFIEISELTGENGSRLRRFVVRATLVPKLEKREFQLLIKENPASETSVVIPLTIRSALP